MVKKIFIILFAIILIIGMCGNVLATDTQTATSTINGVIVNWSYKLNNSNQIVELKCTNSSDLIGNITIPSTLDGKAVVSLGNDCFKSAIGITGVTISSTVIEIGYSAFENCTKLSKVDLGNITTLSFQIFKGCTSLTELTIPKTLKNGSVSPCLDNPNITKITLEEGLTIVPKNLCANTGITEIVIPNTVTEIEYSAFDNCTNLKKITILDNVTKMGFYNVNDSDSIFKSHDENLTIYCYENSLAANYAIKYKIKYVYLTKADTSDGENKEEDKNNNTGNPNDTSLNSVEDKTVATGKLPQTGVSMTIIIVTLATIIVAILCYKKYYNYRDIK